MQKTYTIELGNIHGTQIIKVRGYRAALKAAKGLAQTGNGVVLLRQPADHLGAGQARRIEADEAIPAGPAMRTYTIELGTLGGTQALEVRGYRAATRTARAFAGTSNGAVLLRNDRGEARGVVGGAK